MVPEASTSLNIQLQVACNALLHAILTASQAANGLLQRSLNILKDEADAEAFDSNVQLATCNTFSILLNRIKGVGTKCPPRRGVARYLFIFTRNTAIYRTMDPSTL